VTDRGAVVVTGASTGIGRASAVALAREGFRVFAGVRRDADAASLAEEGVPGLAPLRLDVTDPAGLAAAVRSVDAAVGAAGLAGLVNNAGIAVAGMLEFLPLDDLRRQLEVNVTGVLAVTQAFLPLLRRHADAAPAPGRIVIVGSSSGYSAAPLVGAYTASKYAVEGLADSLRMELRPFRIEVSLVQPGAIATPIWDKSNAEADARLDATPAEARRLYGPLITAVRAMATKRAKDAIPVETVARAVVHALVAQRPRTRYRVGLDAKLQLALARLLPDRVRDAVILRFIGVR
jgi:NAD(P)-dependent dehydrogenase (short-subunit alcohol dehydrogenase family)